ncbi:MAG: hypothetical protein LUE31_08730 [Lachnospiraceae bacterium]|nr:hypothetical protein [Lachnospiraceae bacterium]
MKRQNTVTTVTILISAGAIAATLLLFMTLGNRTFRLWYPLLWLCYGPMLYGADCLFLRQERSAQDLALLNGAAGVALLIVFMLADGWRGVWILITTGTGCIVLSAQAATLCTRPVRLSSVLQLLDVGLALLAVSSAYLGALGMSMVWALPSAIGCVAAILGMRAVQAGGRRAPPPRGWGLLTALLTLITGGVWLGVRMFSRGAGKGLLFFWNALKTAGIAAYEGVYRFVEWFTSLLPGLDYSVLEAEQEMEALNAASTEYAEMTVPRFVYVLPVLLVLVALVILLRYARRFRMRGERIKLQSPEKPVRRRISLWNALKRRLGRLAEGLRLRLYLCRERDTVLGVFYALLRHAYGRSWRDGAGESPREFLTGLAGKAEEDEALYAALIDLIPMVERALYASCAEKENYPEAALLRSRKTGRVLFS